MPKPYIRDFRGGQNSDALPGTLAPNELVLAQNAIIGKLGGISKRGGWSKLNTASLGGHVEQAYEWIKTDGTAVILGLKNVGGVYTLFKVNADGSTTDIQAVAGLISMVPYANRVYFVDGAAMRYYDGAASAAAAIPAAPAAGPTLAAHGSGSFNGDYYGKFSYVDQYGQESALSAASAVAAAANDSHFDWSNVTAGPAGTMSRRLYRTKGDGGRYWFVAEIPNNADTTFKDVVADVDLEEMHAADYELTKVNLATQIVRHTKSARFMLAQGMAFLYTEPNGPAAHRNEAELYPDMGMGAIVGLVCLDDVVLICYEKGFKYWAGIDPAVDASWGDVSTKHFLVAPRTLDLVTNALSFLAEGAWIIMTTAAIGSPKEAVPGENAVVDIAEGKVSSLLTGLADPSIASAAFDHTRKLLFLARCASGTRNTDMLVAWEPAAAFTQWTGAYNDLLFTSGKKLLAAAENFILQHEPDVYHDIDSAGNDVAIEFDIMTDRMDFGVPTEVKTFQGVWVVYKNEHRANQEIRVRVYIDGVEAADETITPSATAGDIVRRRIKLGSRKGVDLQVRITNDQMDMPCEIYGFQPEFEIRTEQAAEEL